MLTNAQAQLARVKSLSTDGFSTEASLDVATRDVATATANVQTAQAALDVSNRRVAVAIATIAAAQAALAKAQYDLSKTTVSAPEPGRVAPFTHAGWRLSPARHRGAGGGDGSSPPRGGRTCPSAISRVSGPASASGSPSARTPG